MASMEVWITYASTYSYLTVSRIGALAQARGVTLDWRPFSLAALRDALKLPFPFPPESPKTAYMWLDVERRARVLGLPYRRPGTYPVNAMQTARVALVGEQEGWCQSFTEHVFRLHWTEGRLIGTEDNLRTSLESLGLDVDAVIAQARLQNITDRLERRSADALARGIFGAPSFVVNGELFWGDDRLEMALDCATGA
jgi:2-hydroxychromene-2-carboxylate isomerase